jgi:hypothetical protein
MTPRRSILLNLLLPLPLLAACATPAPAPAPVPTIESAPIAISGTRPLRWDDLREPLAEIAGGIVLEEVLLDRAVRDRALRAGIELDAEMLASERRLLLENLDADPDRAEELLARIRARQGLGPRRFDALLRRNALLRRLVAEEVSVEASAIERIHDIRHGPRRRSRLIASGSLAEAAEIVGALHRGESFADLAIARSIDPSAAAGGLLPAVARLDPAWPVAFREALFATPPGTHSEPIFSDGAWILVAVLDETPGDGTSIEAERALLERLARLQQERVLMDQLARRLVADLDPRILDPALADGWRLLRASQQR